MSARNKQCMTGWRIKNQHRLRVWVRSLTCHEAMHMEERHDNQRLVLVRQLVGGNDVGQTGCQIPLVQGDALHDMDF